MISGVYYILVPCFALLASVMCTLVCPVFPVRPVRPLYALIGVVDAIRLCIPGRAAAVEQRGQTLPSSATSTDLASPLTCRHPGPLSLTQSLVVGGTGEVQTQVQAVQTLRCARGLLGTYCHQAHRSKTARPSVCHHARFNAAIPGRLARRRAKPFQSVRASPGGPVCTALVAPAPAFSLKIH